MLEQIAANTILKNDGLLFPLQIHACAWIVNWVLANLLNEALLQTFEDIARMQAPMSPCFFQEAHIFCLWTPAICLWTPAETALSVVNKGPCLFLKDRFRNLCCVQLPVTQQCCMLMSYSVIMTKNALLTSNNKRSMVLIQVAYVLDHATSAGL